MRTLKWSLRSLTTARCIRSENLFIQEIEMRGWLERKGLTVGDVIKVGLCMGFLLALVGVLTYGAVMALLT